MLAQKFTAETPLPFAGSTGYLRGTLAKVRVLRRDPDGQCLVKLLDERPTLASDRIASGNTRVAEADIYATEHLARWCGNPPEARQSRSRRKARS